MNNELSPVLLFVFNRPNHTLETINALKNAIYANRTDLFIFCDTPDFNANKKLKSNNLEVIKIINNITGFKSVNVTIRRSNHGLSKNIISGIDFVFKFSKKIM